MKEYFVQKFTPTGKQTRFNGILKDRRVKIRNWQIQLNVVFNSISENGRGRKLKYGEFC